MYTVSRRMGRRGNPFYLDSDLRRSRCYSSQNNSQMQRLLEFARKQRDTSNRWSKSGAKTTAPFKGTSSQPYEGGFARNHLRSTPKSHLIPEFKPFFTKETAVNIHKSSPAKESEHKESQQQSPPQPEANSTAAKPAPSGGRFFFGTKRGVTNNEMPSAKWGPKLITKQTSDSIKETTVSKTESGGSTIRPNAMLDLLKLSRERGKMKQAKFNEEHQRKKASEASQEGVSHDNKKNASKNGVQGYKDKQKPRETEKVKPKKTRDGPSRRLRSGDLDVAEEMDDEDKVKRRRKKKLKMPKMGQEVKIPLTITVDGLAKLLGVPNDHLLRKMSHMGMDKLANDFLLSGEEAADIALEYRVVPVLPEDKGPELHPLPIPDDMSMHPTRPPIVTIMGHVDHGKTTLLDTLRNSSITASEAGGITQHIGAFSVQLKSGQNITFLDTPGHAAFSAMRARGANATDIVVLVVAADDGVMPQTKEAIQHALDADVPIIVAINKCDKPGVDPSLIKEELLQYGIQTEDLGGDIQAVHISALKGEGMEELSENITTLAEVLDLRAEVDIPVQATIIESQVEKGRGNVASVLVNRGTLKVGDIIVAGTAWCKVRSMTDDRGKSVKSIGPAGTVRVMGWKEIPQAGDMVLQAETESKAKDVVENRISKRKNKEQLASLEAMNQTRRETHERDAVERADEKAYSKAVWEYHNGLRSTFPEPPKVDKPNVDAPKPQAVPTVPIVVKGDVSGTVEAVEAALKRLPKKLIQASVLSSGVGPVTESDVAIASTGHEGVIIAFNVKADKKTQSVAKREKVQIMTSRIIYKLLEDIEELMVSRLPPLYVDEVQGEAVVQQLFDITVKGNTTTNIAGSRVTSGTITKADKASVVRKGKVVFTGEVSSLRNLKTDIAETTKGQEFGIAFAGFEDVREGDVIQSFRQKKLERKLE